MVEEIAFPRGSSRLPKKIDVSESDSKKLRPSQKRKVAADASSGSVNNPTASSIKKDILFGSSKKKKDDGTSTTSSKRRKTDDVSAPSSNTHSLMPLGGGGVVVSTKTHKHKSGDTGSTSTSTHIESLGFSKMAKGSKILACVREVQEHYAIVSLPNLLTAYILPQSKPGQDSKYPLANVLQVGQTLAVVVTKIAIEQVKGGQSRRRIQVSVSPQAVNPRLLLAGEVGNKGDSGIASAANRLARASVPLRGQIMSVEDHGCIIELGFGKRGFLRFDQVGGGEKAKDNNYVILEEDENYEDEEDDDPSKRPLILQKGRVYDFLVLPMSSSGKDQSTSTVFPLTLPKIQAMATKMVSSLTSNSSNKSGKRGSTKTTTVPFSFASLTPGWLVQVKIEAIANNGLCVSFFGNVFRGAIEMNHLGATLIPEVNDGNSAMGRDRSFQKLASSLFHEHQHFTARILAIDVPTKLVRLSITPHILTLSNPSGSNNPLQEFPSVGTVVSNCTVVKLDPGIGALLALPSQYNLKPASLLPKGLMKSCDLFQSAAFQEASHIRKVYVHISKALDDAEEVDADNDKTITGKFQKEFSLSTNHDVRILSTGHWLEGVATGGCAPSIITAPVLTHEDLIPGKVYKQVPICGHLPGGSVLVKLGGGTSKSSKGGKKKSSSTSHQIMGLIPPTQLFDVASNDSSEFRQRIFKTKYAIDAKIDVRVLWVDPLRKKCLVSAKKTLVQAASGDIITEYADAKIGQLAVGFVSRVDDQGLCITFCNRVYGRVTARSLAAELGVEDHKENFSIGDVVTARVVKLKQVVRKGSAMEDDDYDDEMHDEADDSINHAHRKHWELTLSLKVHKEEDDDMEVEDEMESENVDIHNSKQVRLLAGAILPAKSMKIVELVAGKTKKSDGYVPGYAIVSIKSKYLVDGESLGKSKMLSYIECKLPFNNLLDSYDPVDIENAENLDALAKRVLTVGKKIKQQGLVLVDPRKPIVDYASGIGTMPVVSLRKALIQSIESQGDKTEEQPDKVPIVPLPSTSLYVGAHLLGFIARIDTRHGAFVRFLDGMTGMIPKTNGGLQLRLYDTLVTKVTVIDDSVLPHRILLEQASPVSENKTSNQKTKKSKTSFQVGDKISKATISSINFEYISLTTGPKNECIFIHCTNKNAALSTIKKQKKRLPKQSRAKISKYHPFYDLKNGQKLENLTVIFVQKNQVWVTENADQGKIDHASSFIERSSQLQPGMKINGVVAAYGKENGGIFVRVGPNITGFISGLELSRDVKLLNDMQSNIPLGAVIECLVIKLQTKRNSEDPFLLLSVLACESNSAVIPKHSKGDLVIGRINRSLDPVLAPSIMLNLRGGIGRCCVTELDEPDEWENMASCLSKKDNVTKDNGNDAMNEEDEEIEPADENEVNE